MLTDINMSDYNGKGNIKVKKITDCWWMKKRETQFFSKVATELHSPIRFSERKLSKKFSIVPNKKSVEDGESLNSNSHNTNSQEKILTDIIEGRGS